MIKKHTKIICTLGPACDSVEMITKMVHAGMNIARLNFSHGSYETHKKLIQNIRTVERETGLPIAIMQDLQGPKIRVGNLPPEGVVLEDNKIYQYDTRAVEYKNGIIPIDYEDMHKLLKKGDRFLMDDGKIEGVVEKVVGTRISIKIIMGGVLGGHKGINIPDSDENVRAMTDKDREDAKFGVANDVDFIALSFVTNAADILDLRFLIEDYEKKLKIKKDKRQPIGIVAKIERDDAVDNIEEIIDVADGIMVARGDLGVEMPAADVPLIQKHVIDLCLSAGKPVIVATQMLDSMQKSMRPTRAEVSDVANAVIDHTDAVMLSNETATGKFPLQAVKTMAEIVSETEKSVYNDLTVEEPSVKKSRPVDDVMCQLSRELAERVHAKIILTASITGDTARLIGRYRPELPILVGVVNERVRRQLCMSWGIIPFMLEPCNSIEELVSRSLVYLKDEKFVGKGDSIIVVAGEPVGHAGHVNLLEVRKI